MLFEFHDSLSKTYAGRLQFTMGAWGMADEAVPTYIGLIDSHTLGLRFLKQEFGECGVPRTAWQIDPFGHSREFAYLFAMVCTCRSVCDVKFYMIKVSSLVIYSC